MESPRADVELQVSEAGLHVQAGLCESSASLLAGNTAPTDAGSSVLASSAAVNAAHLQIAAAGIRCASRMQATATKLAIGSTGYGQNEASSAAQFRSMSRVLV